MLEARRAVSAQRELLCDSAALLDGGLAVDFSVLYRQEVQSAFAVRFQGQVHAYLNRCAHVPIELDFQRNRFFDSSGLWLICSTHGAMYEPQTGQCCFGPCRTGLIKVDISEADGQVYWHTSALIQPLTALL